MSEGLEDHLIRDAGHFQFAQWIRLWLRTRPRESRDTALRLLEDGLDIRNNGSMAFAPGDLDKCVASARGRTRLDVHFMGLTGAVSPLPSYFLEGLARGRERHAVLKAFFDLFDRRIYALYALGVLHRHPGLRAELGPADSLQARLLAFSGRGPDKDMARAMGNWASLGANARSREGLRRFFMGCLGTSCVEVLDQEVGWVRGGGAALGNMCLDGGAALGERIAVVGAVLTVRLGPLEPQVYLTIAAKREEYQRTFEAMFADILDCSRSWRVVVTLHISGGALPCRLGAAQAPCLGVFAWLGESCHEPQEMIFENR